jgi:hypothetical protein
MKNVLIFTLLAVYSCQLNKELNQTNNEDMLAVVVPLNLSNNDGFGVPVTIEGRDELFINLSKQDTVSIELNGKWVFIRNDMFIKVHYKSSSIELTGHLTLLGFPEIRYKKSVSVGTFPDVEMKLTPFRVFNPVRTRKWVIKEQGKGSKVIEYRITVDKDL